MDLLQDNNNKKNEKKTAQKIVLSLLIVSVILCVIIAGVLVYLSIQEQAKAFSISINGQSVNLNELQLINNEEGKIYISLKSLSSKLGYRYLNGEFKIPGEGENKGYIDNQKNIVQFFTDSKEIYKTTENSNTDYEYYNLENPILEYEGNIYIAINDLDVALNLIINHSETNNQTTIETPENWILQRENAFEEQQNTIISNTPENLKALSYGYVIITKDNRSGVISLKDGSEVIGNKYSSITFCEYNANFIVSNTSNKFGVITKSGIADVDLQYDSLEVINYNPLLYKVKRLEKYGIIKENGSVINNIQYDSIGYPEDKSQEINYTLIIPNLNENIPDSIVVCIDKKYGLIELETGREIMSCIAAGIYSKVEAPTTYYVETQNEKLYKLETFVENLNRLTTSVD